MMKKSGAILIATLALTSIVFCACSVQGQTQGQTQSTPSPYEIAVKDGYTGSESTWLAQTVGEDSLYRILYDEALETGYEGDYLSFLKELGIAGVDGGAAVSSALASTVSIQSTFTVTEYYYSGSFRPTLQERDVEVSSQGSGVLYAVDKSEGDAYVLTNYHVVYEASSKGTESIPHISDDVQVWLYGETESISATYVGGAMDFDIALLRIEDSQILRESTACAVRLGNSNMLAVGESVFAVGNAAGEGIAASRGIISVDAEYISITSVDETRQISLLEIRTDAAVNHGNSGGGLFDSEGRLVGIVNARLEEDGVDAFGYAIPVNLAAAVAENVLSNGGTGALVLDLGMEIDVVDSKSIYDEERARMYLEETVQAKKIAEGGVASRAGVKAEDILYSITINGDEEVFTRGYMVNLSLLKVCVGDEVSITVWQDGEKKTFLLSFTTEDMIAYS